eukprot:m.35677 g.35677  ORF g.35677 m.35677 type:complete len:55 (-) comp15797_c0_seq1:165-329(-)
MKRSHREKTDEVVSLVNFRFESSSGLLCLVRFLDFCLCCPIWFRMINSLVLFQR